MEALSSYGPTGSSLLPILFTWGTKKVNNLSKVTNKMLNQIEVARLLLGDMLN